MAASDINAVTAGWRASRLRRPAEYRAVYQDGRRYFSPHFIWFARPLPTQQSSRFGMTTPRKLGTAVERNRIRRRLREALLCSWTTVPPGWELVFNPRRSVLNAPFAELQSEVLQAVRRLVLPTAGERS